MLYIIMMIKKHIIFIINYPICKVVYITYAIVIGFYRSILGLDRSSKLMLRKSRKARC